MTDEATGGDAARIAELEARNAELEAAATDRADADARADEEKVDDRTPEEKIAAGDALTDADVRRLERGEE